MVDGDEWQKIALFAKEIIAMRQCVYCGESAGLFGRICGECKKLLARVDELRGNVGFGQFLDADPDGKGSVRDQVTAEMTSELMKVMGIAGRQTAPEVKRIRKSVNKESD